MKKLICVFAAVVMFSMVSYGGQWQSDDRGSWYRNDDGSWQTGWFQDTDGKWYYLDEQSGYMLAGTTTPDGFSVSGDGDWLQEIPQQKFLYNEEEFDRKAELSITSYSIGPSDVEVLEYPVPVTVYYNNTYVNPFGGEVQILDIALTSQGAPYIRYHVDTDGGAYEFKAQCRYNLKNGKRKDSEERIFGYCGSGGFDDSHHLLWREISGIAKRNSNLVSAEVIIREVSSE